MSCCLVHINPKPVTEGDDGPGVNYENTDYSIASDYVRNEIKRRFQQTNLSAAMDVLPIDGELLSDPFGEGRRNRIFKKVCLRAEPMEKKTIVVTALNESNPFQTRQFTLPPMQELDRNWAASNSSDNNRDHLSVNVLYQPRIPNLESGDAFCVIEKDNHRLLVVLQLTDSETHPVKMSGLKAIEKAFPKGLKYDAMILLFVTPADGKLRSVQNIVTSKRGAPVRRGSEEYQQYVYRFKYEFNTVLL